MAPGRSGGAPSPASTIEGARPTTPHLLAPPEMVPPDRVRVRRSVYDLDPDGPELSALRRGVEAMRRRPADDPTSWVFQANIHGTYDRPAHPAWNGCQHGSFFFLSWHRMYLHFFERVLRAASGDDDFALPYWSYDVPGQRAVPRPFRDPAADSNPLFVRERAPGVNAGYALPETAVAHAVAFRELAFVAPPHLGPQLRGAAGAGAAALPPGVRPARDPAPQRRPLPRRRPRRVDGGPEPRRPRPPLLAPPRERRPAVEAVARPGRWPGQPRGGGAVDGHGVRVLRRGRGGGPHERSRRPRHRRSPRLPVRRRSPHLSPPSWPSAAADGQEGGRSPLEPRGGRPGRRSRPHPTPT